MYGSRDGITMPVSWPEPNLEPPDEAVYGGEPPCDEELEPEPAELDELDGEPTRPRIVRFSPSRVTVLDRLRRAVAWLDLDPSRWGQGYLCPLPGRYCVLGATDPEYAASTVGDLECGFPPWLRELADRDSRIGMLATAIVDVNDLAIDWPDARRKIVPMLDGFEALAVEGAGGVW